MIYPYLLLSSIIIPFSVGVLFLILVKDMEALLARFLGIFGASFPFICAWVIYFNYDTNNLDAYNFELILPTGLESLGIYLHLGLNGLSLPLLLLATTVGLSAIIYTLFSKAIGNNIYVGLLFIMFSGLIGTFSSVDLFFFYFFHELALIPTFIIVMLWGGVDRHAIALEMTIYLTIGALLSLIGLISLYQTSGAEAFNMIELKMALASQPLSELFQTNIFALLFFGFGILVSLFPFHSWAPKGYYAAPTGVAMMHAGVLKKFGLYGLLQIAIPLLPLGASNWASWLLVLGLCNILLIGLVTLAQKDLKKMVGYSSIMHMGYAFIGLGTLSILGSGGVLILLVAHGLSVALLFLLSTCIYHRFKTFNMEKMGGLGAIAPNLSVLFGLSILASIGLPGFANFWGEFVIFTALAESDLTQGFLYLAVIGIIISAIYGLKAIALIVFGVPSEVLKEKFHNGSLRDMSYLEIFCSIILFASLLLYGIFPKVLSDPINESLSKYNAFISTSVESRLLNNLNLKLDTYNE